MKTERNFVVLEHKAIVDDWANTRYFTKEEAEAEVKDMSNDPDSDYTVEEVS